MKEFISVSFVIAEWRIIDCLFPISILTLTEKLNVFVVADNSSITTESIPTSLLVESCKLCNDNGTFDYKESENATNFDDMKENYDDSLSHDKVMKHYNCTEEVGGLNDTNNHSEGWTSMLSIDECTELKEQCIDCH